MRMLLIKVAIDLGFSVRQRGGVVYVGTRPNPQFWVPVTNLNELMEVVA